MSSLIKKTALAFGIFFTVISLKINKVQAQPNTPISIQVFYDELSGYGDWVNNPDYGYVWRPNVGSDFRPYYTNGHWVMTEYGNTWVSDYDWGWAPFHYGRWFYDDYDGWVWAPDTVWGPAWVTWRTGGGYYGWAPLGPRINISINIGRRYYIPDNYWVFIPQRCIYYPSYNRYWEPGRNVYIIHNTTIINNVYTNDRVRYYSGPGRDDVRRATRSDVPVYRISDNNRPGSTRVDRDEVNIYRPNIARTGNDAPRSIVDNPARPSRTSTANDSRTNSTFNNTRPDRSGSSDAGNNRTSNAEPRSPMNNGRDNSSYNRPERTASPRNDSPQPRTESTRNEQPAPSPSRSEAPSNRPQRVERSAPAPREQTSAPTRQAERSGSSSRDGGSGRPSR
jgi:hypothetical protein